MSTLFIGLKNIDDDKKLSGKVYFEDSDAFEPLVFGKDRTEYWISFENKPEMDDDELDAVRDAVSEIKEIVPSAIAAYCSDESEGTGQFYLIFSDSDDPEIHELCSEDVPYVDDLGSPDWFTEAYELAGIAKSDAAKPAAFITCKVGDVIAFGNYKMPITWKVLDIEDGKALIICEKLIEKMKFSDIDKHPEMYEWKGSIIRKWLNEDFYNEAFNTEEKELIIETCLPSVDTTDKVFILSSEEVEKYFRKKGDRKCAEITCLQPTKYDSKNWWTIDASAFNHTGEDTNRALYVMSQMGFSDIFVRPAMWIRTK